MNLEAQIKNMDNPQRFNQLFDALMVAEFGEDYQPIDDSRADGGNDGYLRSQSKVYAHHCFKKSDKQRSDAAILLKIKSDFKKTIELRNSREYGVKQWTFATNYPVSENVINQVEKLARANDIECNCVGPEYIAQLIIKHAEVMVNFPEIDLIFIGADILEVKEIVKEIAANIKSTNTATTDTDAPLAESNKLEEPQIEMRVRTDMDNTDVKRALELNIPNVSKTEKTEIKSMILSTENDSARVQAAFSLCQMYDPLEDNPREFIDLIEIAARTASINSWDADLAVLLAEKASMIAHQQIISQIECWGLQMQQQAFGNLIDLSQELETVFQKLQNLENDLKEVMVSAMDVAQRANDWETYGHVLLHVGQISGGIAGIMHKHGDNDLAASNLSLAKNTLTEAKNCFERAGLRDKRVYAIHNLANQLRAFESEKDTALVLANQVIAESEKLGLVELNRKAKIMKQSIITGAVPD
ncbi:MAG TPA: hypothetical protein VN247_08650 [Arenimonas sp.]|nr:hypothetical protein [Arenimonas sp.]